MQMAEIDRPTQPLPLRPNIFERDPAAAPQERFSNATGYIAVVALKERYEGHLLDFLININQQEGVDDKKRGYTFVVNDTASDKHDDKITGINQRSARYLTMLSQRDFEGIRDSDMSQVHKDVAEAVAKNDQLEIRVDFIHSHADEPHFGEIRLHQWNLGPELIAADRPYHETILDYLDIDTRLGRYYTRDLIADYEKDPGLMINFSDTDLIPGGHETASDDEDDISRETLLHLDLSRLYTYGGQVYAAIAGGLSSGQPSISGRFSYFYSSSHGKFIAQLLERTPTNEDFSIGIIARQALAYTASEPGYNGEVYNLHRTRRTTTPFAQRVLTDGEATYRTITQNRFERTGFDRDYDLLTEADAFIADLEEEVEVTHNDDARYAGHTSGYRDQDLYKFIKTVEKQRERKKVERRRARLFQFIDSLTPGEQLEPNVERTIAPYVVHFSDEVAFIKQLQNAQQSPEQILAALMQKDERYDSFFDPNAPIHEQIVRLRTLKQYVLTCNISRVAQAKESLDYPRTKDLVTLIETKVPIVKRIL